MGKLLGITTAQEDNAEQLTVAEINPFRYRGYYYDNETGMYYLQSRYYDPYLCRFISADDFAYINTDTPMSVNAYAYCINNPLKYKDPKGTKASNESPTYLVESVLDIILSLMIFDEISINMIDIFGYDLTDNFFWLFEQYFFINSTFA